MRGAKGKTLNNVRLARKINALARRHAKLTFMDEYSAQYLEKIVLEIKRLKKRAGTYLYTSMILISEPDQLNQTKLVGAVSYGPCGKAMDKDGNFKYLASFNPPKNIKFSS